MRTVSDNAISSSVRMQTQTRLVLGTAQLGLDYGVANGAGKPSIETANGLVRAAVNNGVTEFDTAAAYGDSERVLGRALAVCEAKTTVNVVSKGALRARDRRPPAQQVAASLERLGLLQLSAWLVHDETEVATMSAAECETLLQLVHDGLARRVGVSVYHPAAALFAVERHHLSVIQFPASPFDRRFLREDTAHRLMAGGAALYVRSVYLQGLCLMNPASVPAGIVRGREAVQRLADFCERHDVSRDKFCVHYVRQRTAAAEAKLVLGAETEAQLERNAELFASPLLPSEWFDEWDREWPDDIEELVLPTKWSTG